jgi:hypothetical protein
MGQPPIGAASPMACAKLYNIPIRRLLRAIKIGDCEPPRKCGTRHLCTYASIERYLETFPLVPTRTNNGDFPC